LQPFLWALEPGSERKRKGRGRGEERKRKKGGEEKKGECDYMPLAVVFGDYYSQCPFFSQ
jgi:hypothetical protein